MTPRTLWSLRFLRYLDKSDPLARTQQSLKIWNPKVIIAMIMMTVPLVVMTESHENVSALPDAPDKPMDWPFRLSLDSLK